MTAPAEEISFTKAKLVGSVNPHGSSTTYYFAWGTSYTSLPNKTPVMSAGKGTHSEIFSQRINGLEPGHEYFFQLVATNGGGTSKGSIGHLVTLKDTSPPGLSLSGSAVAAIEEAKAIGTYELDIAATDAQSGVTKVTVSVDGTLAQTYTQSCPEGGCALNQVWTYSPASYPGAAHMITVEASDLAGNVTPQTITPTEPQGQADGAVGACPASGEAEVGSPTVMTGPGGGTILSYTLGDGTIIEVPRPPAGFDILAASESELEAYGVPPRPAGGVAEEEWIAEYQGLSFQEDSSLCGQTAVGSEGPPLIPPGEEAFVQNRFSGYYVREAETAAFVGLKGTYRVPTAGETPQCAVSAEASWIGMGVLHNGFMQAGTILTNAGHIEPVIQFWKKQSAGGGYHSIRPNIKVHSGDPLQVALTYSKAREKVYYTFIDPETSTLMTVPVHKSTAYYNGSEIEWFEERPFGFAGENLKNFGTIPWSNARGLYGAGGGSFVKMSVLEAKPEVLKVNKTILAEPTGIGPSGEGFQDQFRACKG